MSFSRIVLTAPHTPDTQTGKSDGGAKVVKEPDPNQQPGRYAMSCIRLTAPDGPHAWMNRRIFVGTLQPLRPEREAVLIRGYLMQT